MTGNKPGSHKAKKKTRSSVTKASIISKRQLNLTTPDATVAAVTQTQADDGDPVPITASPSVPNPLSALLSVSSRLLSTLDSPVTDGNAISDMVAGLPLRQLDYIQTTTGTTRPTITQESLNNDETPHTVHEESLGNLQVRESTDVVNDTITSAIPPTNGIAVRQIALSRFKKKTARKGVFKLTTQSVHNLLRVGVSDQLKKSIED